MKARVWAEYLKPKDVYAKKTVALLKRFDVCVGMSFFPDSDNKDYAKLFRTLQDEGLEFAVWVLMDDTHGYFPSEKNVEVYTGRVMQIYDWAEKNKFRIPWLAVDLEPPYYQMKRLQDDTSPLGRGRELIKIARENRDLSRFYEASRRFQKLQEEIHARGSLTLTAASTMIVGDLVTGGTFFQDLNESPVATVQWDVVSFMNYTSMMAGYGKPYGIRPADALWYHYVTCSDAKTALWDRAGVSLGVTYIGKMGDEPYYETPAQLLPDIQAAKAALIEDIAIYNLEGILRSPKPEEWFDTLITAEPKIPPRSLKVDAARALAQMVSRLG